MRSFAPGFLLGVYFAFHCIKLPDLLLISLLWLASVFLFLAHRRVLTILLLGIISGLFWVVIYAWLLIPKSLPEKQLYTAIKIQGVIVDLPMIGQNISSFYFRTTSLSQRTLLKLSWYHNKKFLQPGQQWQLLVKLQAPSALLNPGGFNLKQWALQQKLTATGYVVASKSTNKTLTAHWYDAPISYLRFQ